MARPKSATHNLKREEILEVAASCFAASSYPSASMNDLAHALGTSKARLYHYYDSKQAILSICSTAIPCFCSNWWQRCKPKAANQSSAPKRQFTAWSSVFCKPMKALLPVILLCCTAANFSVKHSEAWWLNDSAKWSAPWAICWHKPTQVASMRKIKYP